MKSPWHDTPSCPCGGPIVPFSHSRPDVAPNIEHVMCAACGKDHLERDTRMLARIYWSAGAWEGHEMRDAEIATSRGVA